jgi:hypothetical protein
MTIKIYIYIYMDLKNNNVISYSHADIFIYKNKNYIFQLSSIKIILIRKLRYSTQCFKQTILFCIVLKLSPAGLSGTRPTRGQVEEKTGEGKTQCDPAG